jgi:uncharacterized protein (TIGR02996 family)
VNEADFLDAIARAPDDDLPRLAFADWLEEKHDPRAARVRNKRIWRYMAPDAADPVPRLVDLARKGADPAELGPILTEIGPAGWNAFVEALNQTWIERPLGIPTVTDWIAVALEPWLEKHRRPAWRPVVEAGDGPLPASKFCGTPWIGADAAWPDCGKCHKPLQLFVQLDLGDLPTELGQAFGTGLLQLFYCTDDWCGGYGWMPFSAVSCVRVVQPTARSANPQAPSEDELFPPSRITSWERFLDPPNSEREEHGLEYIYPARLKCPELGLAFYNVDERSLNDSLGFANLGDKLGGWPFWVQQVSYPNCPRCGRRMGLVFQLGSRDNVPWMFGDSGIGHITQCPEHKDVVAFGWDGS